MSCLLVRPLSAIPMHRKACRDIRSAASQNFFVTMSGINILRTCKCKTTIQERKGEWDDNNFESWSFTRNLGLLLHRRRLRR